MAGARSRSGEPITDINITPLVDVVLVLLIILMVTSSTLVSAAIPAELPAARSGETTSEPLTIVVDASGRASVEGRPLDDDALGRELGALRRRDAGASAVIAADGRVPHARIVEIVDRVREAGLARFAFQVVPAGSAR